MYKCKSCGFKGKVTNDRGGCAACDSMSVKRLNKPLREQVKEREPKTLVEIFIMVVVWALLLYGVWDLYLKPWLSASGEG